MRLLIIVCVLIMASLACVSPAPSPTATPQPLNETYRIPESLLLEVEGVSAVNVALLENGIAYFEIDVLPGFNTSITAWAIYQAVQTVAADATLDFSVILWDGAGPAVDYTLDKGEDRLIETRLGQ